GRSSTSGAREIRRVTVVASLKSRRVYHGDAELPELRRAHGSRRLHHGIRALLRLRERDDVADRFLPGENRRQAIGPERDAAHRRCSEFERVEQEAELRPRFVFRDTEQLEDALLDLLAVDAN